MFEIDLRINCKSGNLTLLELLEVVKIGYEKRQPKQKEIEIDFGGMTFLHKSKADLEGIQITIEETTK